MSRTIQSNPNQARPASFRGWVLYDDDCGFCSRWVSFWHPVFLRRGFDIAPLQSDWVRQRLQLPRAELLQDLRLLLENGKQVLGSDVYRYMTKRIWWAFPVYLFSITPICRRLFDFGYRTFATNRFRFSRACGLRHGPTI